MVVSRSIADIEKNYFLYLKGCNEIQKKEFNDILSKKVDDINIITKQLNELSQGNISDELLKNCFDRLKNELK
jgi:hypothetical protein